MSSININHNTTTISTDDDSMLSITEKGAIKIGNGMYLDELGNPLEIEPKEKYRGALRFNEEKGILQYCDGTRWRDINGQYKQVSEIVWSLLF